MKYLHTMVRVSNLDESVEFYCTHLGLHEVARFDNEAGRFTLVFLAAEETPDAQIELTYNWDPEAYDVGRNFGHLAFEVEDIYATCQRLMDAGISGHLINPGPANSPPAWTTFVTGHFARDHGVRVVAERSRQIFRSRSRQ